jgi:hypothetical protein
MFMITLPVLSKLLVVVRDFSASPMPCRASFPSEKFSIMRHISDSVQTVGNARLLLVMFHYSGHAYFALLALSHWTRYSLLFG